MKRKIRYYSEDKLVLAIDRLTERIKDRMIQAENCDKEATYFYRQLSLVTDPENLKGQELVAYMKTKALAKDNREYAEMIRRNQPRYNARLKRYKEKLGEIRTIPFSFLADASVTIGLIFLLGCSAHKPAHITHLPTPPPREQIITVYTPKGEIRTLMMTPDPSRRTSSQKLTLKVTTPGAAMPDLLLMESAPEQTVRKAKALAEVPLVFPYDFYWSKTGGMERFAPGTMPDKYK